MEYTLCENIVLLPIISVLEVLWAQHFKCIMLESVEELNAEQLLEEVLLLRQEQQQERPR